MDALLDSSTGGYAGRQTTSLANAVYLRLSTPLGAWWAAPAIGSQLHTLAREKDTPRVRRLAVQYAEQSLAALVRDGRAGKVSVAADPPAEAATVRGVIYLRVELIDALGRTQHFNHPVKVA
ncbi:phage GP46 family protein [Caballeronia sp. LZ001]|uniref:phage GP46 family protein n=1 Tax=Caballeronia sp. LZ001 TaxID=3038553 RepID=UPI0028602CD0|nr:phage GP46 family protein [Caballeronia sp. LZ001]MDR5803396.1 phage GP46 family protein [Caballeronia sp. LZ001]